jgi:hypothetical protein
MDWARAIADNRSALIAIVAAIFRMLGLEGEAVLPRMERALHRRALRLLRPAESAARRVIVMAARGLAGEPAPAVRPRAAAGPGRKARTNGDVAVRPRPPAFQLYDPRKSFKARRPPRRKFIMPYVALLGPDPHLVPLWSACQPAAAPIPEPEDDGLISARPLCRRLHALKAALDDVPRQARRLLRWQASRARQQKRRFTFRDPLRPGVPPGYPRTPRHEVDHVLIDCHWLAFQAMEPDTS